MRRILLAVALLAALPLAADVDEQPFFSVSSFRTWTSREKPSIQVSAWSVDSLEFRLYRLQDPIRFFADLKDLHRFGGRAPKPPRARTLLERFHDWKNGWRSEYRRLLREQFDSDAHQRISAFLDRRRASQASRRITNFTPLPLLNPERLVSKWKQTMPRRSGWSYEAVGFDNPGRGVFLMEAANRDLRAYTIVIVSDLAIISKAAPGRLLAFAVDRASGTPVPDTDISILARGRPAGLLHSDRDGIAWTPLVLEHPENVVVLAHRGRDWAVESPFGFDFGEERANPWQGYIYTDRPVYRPGHSVNFKAIFRKQEGLAWTVPQGAIDFAVQDPEGKTVYEKRAVAVSDMGTAWGQFTLQPDAAVGYYSVIARAPNIPQMSGGFNVEEYKKPEYEVRVSPDKPRTLEGDPIDATIDARYFFGEPVANAKVTWVAHRSPWYSPVFRRDEDDDEAAMYGDEADVAGDQVDEHTGKLDGDGKLRISIPTSRGKTDFDYRIEARVTDEANREISGSAHAIAVRGEFAVNVEPARYVYTPGETATFRIQARDYDGNPVGTTMRLELLEQDPRDRQARRILANADGATDATSGEGTIHIVIPKAGVLIARASAKTRLGREVDSETSIWVTSGDFTSFPNGQDVQIVADRKTYKPGDIAKLTIISQSRMDHVLFTVEGRSLDASQVLHPGGKSFVVNVPVKPDYAPDFFVAAAALIDGNLHQGSKSIKVPPSDKQLSIEIQPAKGQYKPGDSAEYTVTARDAAGNPAAAELSLGVVDEAIYSIQRDQTPPIVDAFYGRRYNSVSTESSLGYFFSGAAGTRRMELTKLRPPTALAALKPERLVQPRIRKAFPDTAFWIANLTTDANGRATARFDFPDSLTTWRATARGITRDTKVGSAIEKTVVRKNVMLRIAAPRFLTHGDEVVISAIVHNYLPTAKTARVSLDFKGLTTVKGGQEDVNIPARGDAKADWRVRPQDVASVTITGKALTDEESDAMEISLPVNPLGVKTGYSRSGVLTDNVVSFALPAPQHAAAFGGTIAISAAPSVAGALFGALDYLSTFPYGCTEQILSSFLPNLAVEQASADLHLATGIDRATLNARLNAGLARLYEFQHPDGGWGWWPTDDSSIFMTAYVISGMTQAASLGHPPRADALAKGRAWLRAAISREPKIDPDLRAYAVYALRGDVEPVWNHRAALSPYGLAFLALALEAKHDARASQIAADLESRAAQDSETAHWTLDRDSLMNFYGDTSPEATALALKLLIHQRPASPLIPKAAAWLVAHRNEGLWWSSTKQTAMVIYGLTDYVRQTGELNADFNGSVTVNGQPVLSKHFMRKDALSAVPERAVIANVNPGQAAVQITRHGTGRLYWSVRDDFYSTDKKLVDAGAVRLNIIREYFRMIAGRKEDRIVYDLEPLTGRLAVGDLVGVRLTVSGSEWRYLLTEDPIPSGAEFVSRDDLYELRDPGHWWTNLYSRREFHDDRAAFFNAYFPPGQIQHFYLLKITHAGDFRINPARVYPMYQPDKMATTGAAEMVVE